MKQRRWLELLKKYDLAIVYHLVKTNLVVDALSRKAEIYSLGYIPAEEPLMAMDVQTLANGFVRLDIYEPSKVLSCVVAQSLLFERIKECQYDDPHWFVLKDMV